MFYDVTIEVNVLVEANSKEDALEQALAAIAEDEDNGVTITEAV